MKLVTGLALIATLLGSSPITVLAEYTLILKNGRQITVKNYYEEGPMIKFYGLGGEIGLSKDLIEIIRKSGGDADPGDRSFNVGKKDSASKVSTIVEHSKKENEKSTKENHVSAEDNAEKGAIDEAEHRRRLAENTADLKSATDQYISTSRGGSSTVDPSLPRNEQEIRARTDDLISRVRDAQSRQDGHRFEPQPEPPTPATLSGTLPPLLVPGQSNRVPSVSAAPAPYTESQKELSRLRNHIYQLERERQTLIEETKEQNPDLDSAR